MTPYPFAAPGRLRSLLNDDDSFGSTPRLPRRASALTASVGPGAVNDPGDVTRVENLLAGSGGFDARPAARRGIYDGPVESGLRAFQAGRGLKVDGLINPGGPTETALTIQADRLAGRMPNPARPTLKGLDGETVAANARSVNHLKTTSEDGLFPALLAEDARASRAGRSQVADFFAQLFRADHDRARQMRAKMSLAPHEDRQLFDEVERVLEADAFDDARRRLAGAPLPLGDADDNDDDGGIGTPPAEGGDGGDGDETPPYDPDHPQPGDPDDPDEPEEPEKPEPNCQAERWAVIEAKNALQENVSAQVAANEEIQNAESERERLRERLRTLSEEYSTVAGLGLLVRLIRDKVVQRILMGPAGYIDMILGSSPLDKGQKRWELEKQISELDTKIREEEEKLTRLRREHENLSAELTQAEERLHQCRASDG